ncbi:carboxypeptidase-like regulatory domain-containing protein [Formosa sp. A9]|uniref:carboxypeptidase-like regulatory domain-containing protein n=1 Tax=Formosa sp. A9 TaxID=3442641 RepID=UPI003EB92C25
MKHILKTYLVVFFIGIWSNSILGQSPIVIAGIVVNEKGEKLVGVNVVEEGVSNGVVTNGKGEFVIKMLNLGKLRFSNVGMVPQVIDIKNESKLKVILMDKDDIESDVIVIDYPEKSKSKEKPSLGT